MFNQLIAELSALPEVEAIALGGSRAGENYDQKSDYDVYLYCTSDISEAVRTSILQKYCSYLKSAIISGNMRTTVRSRTGSIWIFSTATCPALPQMSPML